MVFSIICVFLLLFAVFKIFLWLNCRMLMQQEYYEKTRVEAGSAAAGKGIVMLGEGKLPKLDIFGQTELYKKPEELLK